MRPGQLYVGVSLPQRLTDAEEICCFGSSLNTTFGPHDIAHAAALRFYSRMGEAMYHHDIPRFCRFAVKVWDVVMDEAHPEQLEGVETIKRYFKEIGMPTTMSNLELVLLNMTKSQI